jgi:hypothetical protein
MNSIISNNFKDLKKLHKELRPVKCCEGASMKLNGVKEERPCCSIDCKWQELDMITALLEVDCI